MTKEERIQAAQVAFELFQQRMKTDYGVALAINQQCVTLRSDNGSVQSQTTSQFAWGTFEDWVEPSTANGKKGDSKDAIDS